MNYDDIKDKTLSECFGLTIAELYEIFKARYEQEQADVLMKQWGTK